MFSFPCTQCFDKPTNKKVDSLILVLMFTSKFTSFYLKYLKWRLCRRKLHPEPIVFSSTVVPLSNVYRRHEKTNWFQSRITTGLCIVFVCQENVPFAFKTTAPCAERSLIEIILTLNSLCFDNEKNKDRSTFGSLLSLHLLFFKQHSCIISHLKAPAEIPSSIRK